MAVDTTFVGFHSRLHCGIKFFGVHYILVTVKVLMFYQIFTFVSDNLVAVVGNEKKGKIVYPFIHLHDISATIYYVKITHGNMNWNSYDLCGMGQNACKL